MALKKVKRPVLTGEAEVVETEKVETPAVEEEVVTPEVEATEEVVAEETPAEEVKEEKPATTKKATATKAKASTTKAKSTTTKASTAKTATAKKDEEAKPATKKSAPKTKKVELKPVKDTANDTEEVEGNRATKKKVMKLTQQTLEDQGLTISLENLTTIINNFEEVLTEVTNAQSYKFMGGMIQVQERNGQVFKSPKVDYYSYKAPRTVKTFTQDTENVDKFRGQYDAETRIFKADGKWNYDTKEFDPVDLEIVVGEDK
jgi:chemotaxis protein histidine kinase CheA